ncbi:MAG: transcriptional regulator [Pseudanabaena frigida]|uniref:Transcriptional regulator n=1 Tax=Pseudanabaena frigida TaxID=945775 RepID=A0A2W4Y4J5_9CYAN|nr:MAG: transcriptional regulator [Pseudanabaena frigida]
MTDLQDAHNKQKNINQDVRAFDNAHVTAIANIENVGTLNITNHTDRNVSLDDCPASFKHMQGRKEAIADLNIALADPKKAIACIVGLGGYGKSTLAAKLFGGWSKDKRFWADLSQRSRDFREFATRAIAQLGQKSLEHVNNLPEAQLGYELAAVLQSQSFLVVLDNLESLLDGNLERVLWREFLENWANDGEGSKVLIATREEPNLPKLRFFRYELRDGLEDAEGAALLRDFGILGTEAELVAVAQRVGGIPLSLMLIVGLLCNDYEEEPHVRFLPEDLFGIEGAHRLGRVTTEAVFQASFERLELRLQSLLIAVSVFAKPFDRTMAAAMIADEAVTDRDLLLLKKRGFVLAESGCYRFQPQIQELVQRQAESLTKFHRKAISYYWKNRKPTLDPSYDTLEDTDPYLQTFHHYCELGEYESAFYTIRNGANINDIDSFLTLCGYYAKLVELYMRLVSRWQLEQIQQWEYTTSLNSLGNAYYSLGNYQQALSFHWQSLEIKQAIGDKKGEAISLIGLGSTYSSLGQYQKAIAFLKQSLEIDQALGDKKVKSGSLVNLGNAYNFIGQYQQAIAFYQQSLEIQQAISDKYGEASSLIGLGNAYFLLGQYKQVIAFYQQSLEIQQAIGDRNGEASSLTNLGNAYNSIGHYQQAITFYQQSLEIQQAIGDKYGEAISFMNLGEAYHHICKFKEGFVALNRANKLLQELQIPIPESYAKRFILFIRFAQRGKWQIALCFCIGLFAFPLFLAYLGALPLWRFLRSLIKL